MTVGEWLTRNTNLMAMLFVLVVSIGLLLHLAHHDSDNMLMGAAIGWVGGALSNLSMRLNRSSDTSVTTLPNLSTTSVTTSTSVPIVPPEAAKAVEPVPPTATKP